MITTSSNSSKMNSQRPRQADEQCAQGGAFQTPHAANGDDGERLHHDFHGPTLAPQQSSAQWLRPRQRRSPEVKDRV